MESGSLEYHYTLEYARQSSDRRILPGVQLAVEVFPGQQKPVTVYAILNTGAQVSVFDGNVALRAGLTTDEIVERAIGAVPVHGFGPGVPILGYVHEIVGLLGSYSRFAKLTLRVLITMPGQLEYSVLGRSDFFEQVDVTFAERDRRLYFRFRDPAALHTYA